MGNFKNIPYHIYVKTAPLMTRERLKLDVSRGIKAAKIYVRLNGYPAPSRPKAKTKTYSVPVRMHKSDKNSSPKAGTPPFRHKDFNSGRCDWLQIGPMTMRNKYTGKTRMGRIEDHVYT